MKANPETVSLDPVFLAPQEPRKLDGPFQRLRADIRRKQDHYVLSQRFINRYVKVLLQLGTLAVVAYRIGSWVYSQPRLVRLLLWLPYHVFAGPIRWASRTYINPRTRIGGGFVIHNFSAIFVDANEIGANLTINQGVTIGPDFRNDGLPTLGDNVFLGAGAAVLGCITIANNVVAAANSLVSTSVAPNCLVAGVPAIVLSTKLPDDYVSRIPPRAAGMGEAGRG